MRIREEQAAVSEAELRLKTLMVAGLDGDAVAYRELLSELTRYLRAYYRRRLHGGEADAEDLVQETLIAVHTRRASYDRAQPFTAWAYAMARYKFIDHLRRRRVRTEIPIEACEELFAPDELEQAAAARDLEELFDALPADQRQAIRLAKVEGLSINEVASRTGKSAAATKVGIHRGLKRLRQLWSADEKDSDE
jgi:RNA polymerase sigma-70 factor (ECF subfamily)